MDLPRINHQETELVYRDKDTLYLHKVWETIQGEGPFAGMPCVFVRLSGCNLDCPLCDTDYTSIREPISPFDAAERVYSIRHKGLVVITGGEPFRQPLGLTALVDHLLDRGFDIQIESNGCYYEESFPYDDVSLVVSPKTPSIHYKLERKVCALKYILASGHIDPTDGLPTRVLGRDIRVARPWPSGLSEVYVQPEDDQNQMLNRANVIATTSSALKFGYRLSFQIHKYIGLE